MIEDSTAGSDGNFVLTADGAIVEAQIDAPRAKLSTRKACCGCCASPASAARRFSRRS